MVDNSTPFSLFYHFVLSPSYSLTLKRSATDQLPVSMDKVISAIHRYGINSITFRGEVEGCLREVGALHHGHVHRLERGRQPARQYCEYQ